MDEQVTQVQTEGSGSKTWVWILIVIVLVVIGIGAYYLFSGDTGVATTGASSIPQPPALPSG